MSNTALWDKLGKTDPAHTKSFKRSGGFSGTAIKPMWSYRMMTEEFGPCGDGWGINEPSFQVVQGAEGEVLVYCTVSIWHGDKSKIVFGVGGDKAVGKNKYGLSGDDEAFKKAFTDAITNALKLIGVGADVHMGMFDDNKYVNSMKNEFSQKEPAPEPNESKHLFLKECEDRINSFVLEQPLREWWSSEEQKDARRDFELNKEEVAALLNIIKLKIEHMQRKAA